jgi:hypothetical protein
LSSLKARRAAARAIPVMRPVTEQLDMMRGALIHAASQPDSAESRAALRALALGTVFAIDSVRSLGELTKQHPTVR